MQFKEWLKNKILNFLGINKESGNPYDTRLQFINDDDAIKYSQIRANKIWYIGNGDELLNYYTGQNIGGFNENPIYNRNKREYFWSISASEYNFKRVHSGIPHAIIDTLCSVIGTPNIKEPTGVWEKVEKENEFMNKLVQQSRPLTLVEGWGAWKVNFNKDIADVPLWEYYEAEDVEYIIKQGVLIGIVFKSYYKNGTKNYLLTEMRYKRDGNSCIEYQLFELTNKNDVIPVELDCVPELAKLQNKCIEGLNVVLAVPSKYFYDVNNKKYGRSIFDGKLDLFDTLDEVLSMAAQTNHVSAPITVYETDVMQRGKNGGIGLPNIYNRQLVAKEGIPNGDGSTGSNTGIFTDQPNLNFDKYGYLAKDVLDYILTGILSPATMGIDVAKKDNAEAQREKEKVTLFTSNNIIDREQHMLEKIVLYSIYMQEYLDTGKITLQDYDISIDYDTWASPSFEEQLSTLGSAWASGSISTEQYVRLLWGDTLSDEDKAKEIEYLEQNRQVDDTNISDLLGGGEPNGRLEDIGQEQGELL